MASVLGTANLQLSFAPLASKASSKSNRSLANAGSRGLPGRSLPRRSVVTVGAWNKKGSPTTEPTPGEKTKSALDAKKLSKDISSRWDEVENKPLVVVSIAGSVLAIWLSSSIVRAVDRIPLAGGIFELIGLVYSLFFLYNYLFFQDKREAFTQKVKDFIDKTIG